MDSETLPLLEPGLYCVATPIGNLGDFTVRARDTLRQCDRIICEDTRVTSRLLAHYHIDKPLWVYHDHNAEQMRETILAALREGQRLALVSDAGSPLINDPGTKLVRACWEQGLAVRTLPGPCSVIAALTLSGLMSDHFAFHGFFEAKKHRALNTFGGTLVFFESPRRLLATLGVVQQCFSDREIAVVREMTKIYEQVIRGSVDVVHDYFTAHPPRGEIVLVLGQRLQRPPTIDEIQQALHHPLQQYSLKDAVTAVSEQYGWSRKEVYRIALNFSRETQQKLPQ